MQKPLQACGMQQVTFCLVTLPAQNGQTGRSDLAIRQIPVVSIQQKHSLKVGLDGLERKKMLSGF